jgi:hypothetical protein
MPMKPSSKCKVDIPKTLHSHDYSDRVVFILPQLPPAHCGLGDYSMILLEQMAMTPPPKILVMHGAAETLEKHPELDVEQLPRSSQSLEQRLKELRAEKVFVQYVAQGFQERGCPLWFLSALRNWRLGTPDGRLVIMFQELWFEPAWWKPDWLLQKLHRCFLRRLAGSVDQVFVSTEGFAQRMQGATHHERIRVLINPATIPLAAPERNVQRLRGYVVLFGRPGSRLLALTQMEPYLGRLHSAGFLKKLWIVGSRENAAMNDKEDNLLKTLLPSSAVEMLGPQTPEDISHIFQKVEMGMFAKVLHGFTKSTIFMGYASHGVCILSPESIRDAREPLCFVAHPSQLLGGILTPEQVSDRGKRLARWYEENASWAHVAAKYREALSL